MGKSSALNTSNDRVKYTIEIIQNSQSIPNNTSNVTVKVRFYRTNTGYTTYGTGTVYCKINGTTYSASVTSSQAITNAGIELFTKTLNISHGADGKKTLTCSAWISLDTPLTSSEQSYSQVLTTIARYAKITTFTVSKRDETSVTVTWGADVACDKLWYSVDGGAWVVLSGYPTAVISGLKPNTTYSFKIKVGRKDNGLTTESSAYKQTTYDYPHCTKTPDFTIGNELWLTLYNPLGRTVQIYVIGANGKDDGGVTRNGTSCGNYTNNNYINFWYSTIPNAQSGTYKVRVVYGNVTKETTGGTYKIKGTEKPTVNGISYKDIASNIVAITGNDQHIVQNQSNLQITYESATPNYSAGSIKKYSFELNGTVKESTTQGGTVNFGKVNSVSDLTLTLTVTDSRGLTSSKTMKITMLAHSEPTATVTLERLNNYEDETYLTVDASISSVNGKNAMTVQYRYRLSTDEYSPFVTIPNDAKQTFTLDKNSIFIFNVTVTDTFGAKFDQEFILYKGVFPLFIDTEKNAVGINEFPADGEALRVAGGVAHFQDGVKISGEVLGDYVVEEGTSGDWTYTKWHSGRAEMECVVQYNTSVTSQVEMEVSLPFAVSNVKPFVSCLAGGWALSYPPYFILYANETNKIDKLKLYYSAINATLRSYCFAILVKGTWK